MSRLNKIVSVLLFVVVALGLGACAGPPTKAAPTDPGEANNYVTFTKPLPSGAKVECVGWRYSGPQGEGAALECFPVPAGK